MPHVIIRTRSGFFADLNTKLQFSRAVRLLVAHAASTDEMPFVELDVDVNMYEDGEGSLCSPLQIEIRTMGRPERIRRLNEKAVLGLKKSIMSLPSFPHEYIHAYVDTPMIWVQFIDPDGPHV